MFKFITKEKKSNIKVIEKMDNTDSSAIVVGEFKISTPSGTTDIIVGALLDNTPLCTMSNTSCPVGFVSSDVCIGKDDADPNTHVCVMAINYTTPSSN